MKSNSLANMRHLRHLRPFQVIPARIGQIHTQSSLAALHSTRSLKSIVSDRMLGLLRTLGFPDTSKGPIGQGLPCGRNHLGCSDCVIKVLSREWSRIKAMWVENQWKASRAPFPFEPWGSQCLCQARGEASLRNKNLNSQLLRSYHFEVYHCDRVPDVLFSSDSKRTCSTAMWAIGTLVWLWRKICYKRSAM